MYLCQEYICLLRIINTNNYELHQYWQLIILELRLA